MNVIKFSHEYTKMNSEHRPPPTKATLLQVFVVDYKELTPVFKKYDAMYYDQEKQDWSLYPIPRGKLLVLLLKSYGDFLWTTVRRFTPRKFEYYKNHCGEEFLIQIQEENKSG